MNPGLILAPLGDMLKGRTWVALLAAISLVLWAYTAAYITPWLFLKLTVGLLVVGAVLQKIHDCCNALRGREHRGDYQLRYAKDARPATNGPGSAPAPAPTAPRLTGGGGAAVVAGSNLALLVLAILPLCFASCVNSAAVKQSHDAEARATRAILDRASLLVGKIKDPAVQKVWVEDLASDWAIYSRLHVAHASADGVPPLFTETSVDKAIVLITTLLVPKP